MPTIGAVVTDDQNRKIDSLVERGIFLNRSDFVRSAIREFLEGFSTEEAIKRKEIE